MKTIITRHGIELYADELLKMAQENIYIVKYRRIYQVKYSENAGFSTNEIYRYRGKVPLTKKGRYHRMKYKQINNLLGFELLAA